MEKVSIIGLQRKGGVGHGDGERERERERHREKVKSEEAEEKWSRECRVFW